ncbi:hypothetical protein [Mycolicibacterium baixiangningiae]|uniref:hypothetical protein n=1 Tax=Mycolicibacterium baixiangningiae TaxID=2761578 RepID=UPI001E48860A|nr:hypothetical protein [Mycolicibacterium baixiangningiae]
MARTDTLSHVPATIFSHLENIASNAVRLAHMREVGLTGVAAAAAITLIGALGAAPSAHASNFGVELNGTYRAISNGEWAQKNQVYFDEQSTDEIWTITSSCVSPIECTGEIRSNVGWTAPMTFEGSYWTAEHEIPNWVPCPDGTFASGEQKFMIWGVNPVANHRDVKITTLLAGRNVTKGAKGACGRNEQVVKELPVRVEKLT